jgi:hypothetical protein
MTVEADMGGNDRAGMFGAMTPAERVALRRRRRVAAVVRPSHFVGQRPY